jgi:hypothetical protein
MNLFALFSCCGTKTNSLVELKHGIGPSSLMQVGSPAKPRMENLARSGRRTARTANLNLSALPYLWKPVCEKDSSLSSAAQLIRVAWMKWYGAGAVSPTENLQDSRPALLFFCAFC